MPCCLRRAWVKPRGLSMSFRFGFCVRWPPRELTYGCSEKLQTCVSIEFSCVSMYFGIRALGYRFLCSVIAQCFFHEKKLLDLVHLAGGLPKRVPLCGAFGRSNISVLVLRETVCLIHSFHCPIHSTVPWHGKSKYRHSGTSGVLTSIRFGFRLRWFTGATKTCSSMNISKIPG